MACARHEEIENTHQTMMRMMGQIQRENALASKLKRELEHEKVVLQERKAVSTTRASHKKFQIYFD
jgi:hypothetical protein